MTKGGRRAHDRAPETVRLDLARPAGQFRVIDQFLPASDDSIGLGYKFDLHML